MEKKDYLQREDFEVSDICALIDYHSKRKSNISFAIDGEWGCGKSFVLEMVEEKLKKEKINSGLEDRYVVFHYNCWEYDYYDEPLVAIVSMMIEKIKEIINARNEDLRKKGLKKRKIKALNKDKKYRNILAVSTVLKGAGSIALAGINHLAEEKIGISFKDMLDEFHVTEEEIKDIYGSKEILDNINDFDPLTSFNNALNLLRKSIGIIAEDKTVVFVVDELDRCQPDYAIKILERLHHISEGVNNLITVIAVNKSRLLDSISNAFGYDKYNKGTNGVLSASKKYMEKFVKFDYKLDKGVFDSPDDSTKYETYYVLFNKYILTFHLQGFSDYITWLFYEINMREQEYLVEKAEMIHTIVNKDNKKYDDSVMCMELLLTVVYSCYGIKNEDLYSFLTDLENEDNLNDFRSMYFDEDKKTKLKIINDKNYEKRCLAWYAAFLKETSYLLGRLPDDLKSAEGISRDTSIIKEKYGIDMEENLEFLRKFYNKLTHLS